MGTRNLIGVILNNEVKLAQYGQWDGYFTGQGSGVVDFILGHLNTPKGLDRFKRRLQKCSWYTPEEIKEIWTKYGAKGGLIEYHLANQLGEDYPALDRDTGSEILNLVYTGKITKLQNEWEFGGESLFCEYAYVLDLDNQILEIYVGFNKKPLGPTERFKDIPFKKREGDIYYQVRLYKKVLFKDLTKDYMKQISQELSDEDEKAEPLRTNSNK